MPKNLTLVVATQKGLGTLPAVIIISLGAEGVTEVEKLKFHIFSIFTEVVDVLPTANLFGRLTSPNV